MNKFIFILSALIAWSVTCLGYGYFYAKQTVDPIVITQTETVWKDKVIYRDYVSMPAEDILNKLRHYDQDEFKLTFRPLVEANMYRIEGRLYEREAYKDIKIEVGSASNWKFYLGLGSAAAIGAGIYVGLK